MAKNKDSSKDRAEHLGGRIERARKRLAALTDPSEGSAAARAARKRLKRAQRALGKHENYRSVTLAKLAEKKAGQEKAAPAAGGSEGAAQPAAAE